jgi:hypothetical protein
MKIRRGDERKREGRRSVYEDRFPAPEEEERWDRIGELGGPLDFRRIDGKPLGELAAGRWITQE